MEANLREIVQCEWDKKRRVWNVSPSATQIKRDMSPRRLKQNQRWSLQGGEVGNILLFTIPKQLPHHWLLIDSLEQRALSNDEITTYCNGFYLTLVNSMSYWKNETPRMPRDRKGAYWYFQERQMLCNLLQSFIIYLLVNTRSKLH